MSRFDDLANEIEWIHAKERARLKHPTMRRSGPKWLMLCREEFDPHAATELAMLMERRLS